MQNILESLFRQKVFIWFFVAFILVASFFPLEGKLSKIASEATSNLTLSSLVKDNLMYVDESKVLGASTDNKIYAILKTTENQYVLSQIEEAEIVSQNYKGSTTFRFPNGDLYKSSSDNLYVSEIVLRNGIKTQAQIIQNGMTMITLQDGTYMPMEILDAKIVNGRISGIFSGRLVDSGYQVAANVAQNEIVKGYVVASPSFVSARLRTFGFMVLYEEGEVVREANERNKVLAAETDNTLESESSLARLPGGILEDLKDPRKVASYQGRIVKPDYDTGTYAIAGLDEGMDVSLNLVQNLISEEVANIDLSSVINPATVTFDSSVTTTQIEDATIQSLDLADNSILSRHIKDGEVTGLDIANDTIKNEDIAGSAINSGKIEDDTVTTSDLANTLTFGDGDFFDLGAILHDDTSPQGFRLPNTANATPSSPTSGEGYLAYDSSGNQVIFYNGTSWGAVGSGDITTVTAGNGLSGGGTSGDVSLAVNLDTTAADGSVTSSVSGLEIGSDELSLIRGCANGDVLKWDDTNFEWDCAADSGAGGSGIATVEENNSNVVASATNIDFLGADFIVTAAGGGEADIAIDYTNSKIVRSDQNETITGSWTFTPSTTNDLDINLDSDSLLTIDQTFSSTTTANSTTLTIANASSSGTQNGLVIDNAANTGTTESLLVIDNSDTDTAVTNAIEFVDAGGTFTNLFNVNGTTITSAEFTVIDGGIALSELTDSGTLTAGTVDINGGAIDGTAIGASSRSTALFTTLGTNGNVTLGDANSDTVTINAGSSGTGISFGDASFATCTALETVSGVLTCGSDAGGNTLWDAIGNPAGNGDIAMAETVQTLDWNSNDVTAVALDAFTLTFTNDAATDVLTQNLLTLANVDASGSTATEALLVLDNRDTTEAVSDAIRITSAAGGITTGLDFDDTDIATDIEFQNAETLSNDSNGTLVFTGVGQTNNAALTLDFETNASFPILSSSTDTAIGIDEDLTFVGAQSISTTTGDLTIGTNDVNFTGTGGSSGDADVDIDGYLQVGGTAEFDGMIQADGTLDSNGDVTIADTNIAFDGATTTFTTTGAFTLTPGGSVIIGDGGDTLTINSSDTNITVVDGSTVNIDGDTSPTADILQVGSGDVSVTSGVDALQITFDSANTSGNAIDITLSGITGDGSDTTIAIDVDAFSYTSSAGTDTVQGLNIGALTESGTITSTAINLGAGWDTGIAFGNVTREIVLENGEAIIGQAADTITLEDDDGTDYAAFNATTTTLTTTGLTLSGTTTITASSLTALTLGASDLTIGTGDVNFTGTGGSTGNADVDIDGYLQVNGAAEFDSTIQLDGAATFNSTIAANSDITASLVASEDVDFSIDPGADTALNGVQIDFGGEDTIGSDETQYAFYINNLSSGTNVTEVADALIALDTNDADDPVENGIVFLASAAGGFTNGINFDAGDFTSEIILENGEFIRNQSDEVIEIDSTTFTLTGTTTITASSLATLTTAATLSVSGDLTVSGGDITGTNSETIDIGEADNGSIILSGVGETNNESLEFDFETTANEVQLFSSTGVTEVDFGTMAINVASCTGCGGGGGALDTLTAATGDDSAINSGDNTIIWEWDLSSATSRGITIGESGPSSGGSGNQFLLELTTDATSTASPLSIISNSTDAGDIEIDLNSDGDFSIMDAGSPFVTFSDNGSTNFFDDVTFDIGTTESIQINAGGDQTVDMFSVFNDSATSTNGADGIQITFLQGETSGTNSAGHFLVTGSGTSGETASGLQVTTFGVSGGTLYGLTIDNITGGAGTETAINVGSGWDTGIGIVSAIGAEAIDLSPASGVRTTALIDINENNTSGSVPTIQWDSAETRGGLLDANLTGALVTEHFIDITTSAAFTSNILDVNIGAAAATGDIINIDLGATATGSQALVVTSGAMTRTTDLFSIVDSGTSSGDAIELQLSGATTGNGLFLNNDAMVATGHVLYIDSDADRSSTSLFVIDDVADATASAPTIDINMTGVTDENVLNFDMSAAFTGNVIDINSTSTGSGNGLDMTFSSAAATGNALDLNMGTNVAGNGLDIATSATTGNAIDITTSGIFTNELIDINLGAQASTGDVISIAMGSSAPAAQALVVSGSSSTATGGVVSLAIDTAAAQSTDIIDITSTLGIMDGSDTFQAIDINITGANHTSTSNVITGIDLALTTPDADAAERGLNFSDNNFDTDINATTDLTLGIGGTNETILTATAFSPATSDGNALGTNSLAWSDLFLADGSTITFNNDITITHFTDRITFNGGGYFLSATDGNSTFIYGDANPTADLLVIGNSDTSATSGTDGIRVDLAMNNASGSSIHVVPSFTGGATNGLTYNVFEVDAFSPTNAAGTDTVNGILFGNLTDPGATITSTAVNIGTGWDTIIGGTTAGTSIFDFTNFDVTSAGALDVGSTITAGSGNTVLTLSTGMIDADALTLAPNDGSGGTASASGLEVGSDGLTLLQGCTDGQLLEWTDAGGWACASDDNSGGATAWNAIADPTGANSITFGDGETSTFIYSTTTGDQNAFIFDFNQVDDGASTDDFDAMRFDLTSESGDAGDTFDGIVINWENGTANTIMDSALKIDNAETTASTMTDGIIITSSGANGGVVDAIDVSAANITNGINLGNNNIVMGDGGALPITDGTNTIFSVVDNTDANGGAMIRFGAGKTAAGDPATCTEGDIYYNDAEDSIKMCHESNVWEELDNNSDWITVKRKTADETVTSNTTVQNDDHLLFAVGASENWVFKFYMMIQAANTTPDVRVTVASPASPTYCRFFFNDLEAGNSTADTACGTTVNATAVTTADDSWYVGGSIDNGANAGNVTLQWAQNTTSTSGTTVSRGSYLTAFKVQGADLAEFYPTRDFSLSEGDVVSMDGDIRAGVKKSDKPYQMDAIGVVSTQPGLALGDSDLNQSGTKPVPIALSGRVPIKVSNEGGAIEQGDYLTSSSTPGVAMKAVRAGPVVAQAMLPWDGLDGDVGTTLGFIRSGYFNGESVDSILAEAAENGLLDPGGGPPDKATQVLNLLMYDKERVLGHSVGTDIVVDRVVAGLEIITPRIVADEIIVNRLKANVIEGLEIYTDQIGLLSDRLAGVDSDILSLQDGNLGTDNLAPLITFNTLDSLVVQNSLNVLGISTFSGLSVFNGNTEFSGGVEFSDSPVFPKSTAGYAVITEGARAVKVVFDKEYQKAPVVNVSPIWDIDETSLDTLNELGVFVAPKQDYIIANVTTKGFSIVLEENAVSELKFTWTALMVQDAQTSTNLVATPPLPTPTVYEENLISPTPTPEEPDVTPIPSTTPTP